MGNIFQRLLGWELGPQSCSTQRRGAAEEVTGPWVVWFHQWINLWRTPSFLHVRICILQAECILHSECIYILRCIENFERPDFSEEVGHWVGSWKYVFSPCSWILHKFQVIMSQMGLPFHIFFIMYAVLPLNWHLQDCELKSVFLLWADTLRYFVSVAGSWLIRGHSLNGILWAIF